MTKKNKSLQENDDFWIEGDDSHGNKYLKMNPKYYASYGAVPEISQLTDNLYVGTLEGVRNLVKRNPQDINVVVNVCCEKFAETGILPPKELVVHDILLYDGVNPPLNKVKKIFAIINSAVLKGQKVVVNCHAGISRSVCMCAGYLVYSRQFKNTDEAVNFIKGKRSIAHPASQVMKGVKVVLKEWPYEGDRDFSYYPVDPDDPKEKQWIELQSRIGF